MVGTAVWSPYHLLTPSVTLLFWLQRAISCVEKQADGEGVGAGVSLVVLAFSPPRGSSCFSFLLSFCPFPLPLVFYSLCPSYFLLFHICTVTTPPNSCSLLVSSYHPVTRYFPLTSNKQLLFFSCLELAFLFSLLYVSAYKLLPDEMWLTRWHTPLSRSCLL